MVASIPEADDAATSNFFADKAKQLEFDEQGFVVIDLISAAEARELRARSQDCRPPLGRANDPSGSTYMSVFDGDRRRAADQLIRASLSEAIKRHIRGFRDVVGLFFIKEPGCKVLPAHQHPPAQYDLTGVTLHCWCALDDIPVGHAELQIVPHSHRLTRHVETLRFPPYFASFADTLLDRHAVSVPLRAGQAIVFDHSILHGSGVHHGNEDRVVASVLMVPEGVDHVHVADEPGNEFEAVVVPDPYLAPEIYGGPLPDSVAWRRLGKIDAIQSPMTESEFVELLRRNQRISADFDPLTALRRERLPERGLRSWIARLRQRQAEPAC